VDPLKPFNSIVRSVWDRTVQRTDRTEKVGATAKGASDAQSPALGESAPIQTVQERIRARLAQQGSWDSHQIRELFVESVLLSELGAELIKDPGFGQIVAKISGQLNSHPELSARLDALLKEMAREPLAK
jgi:hypothetical protein